jgi:hypothetical protein
MRCLSLALGLLLVVPGAAHSVADICRDGCVPGAAEGGGFASERCILNAFVCNDLSVSDSARILTAGARIAGSLVR